MRKRRPRSEPSSMTSLLDVLFILVFASVVQAAKRSNDSAEAAPPPEPVAAAPVDAGVAPPDAQPPRAPDEPVLRQAAVDALTAELVGKPAIIVRIANDTLAAVELEGRRLDLGVPLIERVPEQPDVAIAYLGDRSAELQICRVVTLRLGLPDLKGHLVVIAPDRPIADLTVALVAGLRRDARRCLDDHGGPAVVVDQGPPGPTPPRTPGALP